MNRKQFTNWLILEGWTAYLWSGAIMPTPEDERGSDACGVPTPFIDHPSKGRVCGSLTRSEVEFLPPAHGSLARLHSFSPVDLDAVPGRYLRKWASILQKAGLL
jgi:hypothetical protein